MKSEKEAEWLEAEKVTEVQVKIHSCQIFPFKEKTQKGDEDRRFYQQGGCKKKVKMQKISQPCSEGYPST